MRDAGDIREYWDARAREHGTSGRSTLLDERLRELEIAAIARHLEDGQRVLDAGCGNGFSTLRFASGARLDVTGIDFSAEMIKHAEAALEPARAGLAPGSRVAFLRGDVLDLAFAEGHFDLAISERCLQNLLSFADQRQAILGIARVLKPGGRFVMAECSVDGLDRTRRALRRIGRPEPRDVLPWHNLFFSDRQLLADPEVRKAFEPLRIHHFASTHTFLSRALPSRLKPLVAHLPNLGRFGWNQVYLWRKRD